MPSGPHCAPLGVLLSFLLRGCGGGGGDPQLPQDRWKFSAVRLVGGGQADVP